MDRAPFNLQTGAVTSESKGGSVFATTMSPRRTRHIKEKQAAK